VRKENARGAAEGEKRRAYQREWWAKNREENLAKSKAKYEKNKETYKAAHRKWKAENREQHLADSRRLHLWKKYKITVAQYDAMLDQQGGKCAICRGDCTSGRRLAVDHCHTTGRVRALLCYVCNTSIGKFEESPERFRRAAEYLEMHA
jgi:hypothetical protein